MPFSYDLNPDDANRARRRASRGGDKGERIEYKALGANIGSLSRGAAVFDPNAEDGDGDGLVQDSTPFERPAILTSAPLTLREGLASASLTGLFSGGKSNLVGLTNRQVAERVVPDNAATFTEMRLLHSRGFPLREDGAIQNVSFDPDDVEQLRQIVENTLDERPALRASWDRFGAPPMAMVTGDNDFAGQFTTEAIYINKNSIEKSLARRVGSKLGIKLTNSLMAAKIKGVKKFLVSEDAEDTVAHEWGHYLHRLVGDYHPDFDMRKAANALYSGSWRNMKHDRSGARTLLGLGDFWDYWENVDANWLDKHDPPSDDIPFVNSGYGTSEPAEFVAEAVAAYFSPDSKTRALLNDAGAQLVEKMLGVERGGLASSTRPTSTGNSLGGKSAADIADIVVPKTLNEALALIDDHQKLLALDDEKDVDTANLRYAFRGGVDSLDFSPEAQEMLRGLVTDALINNPLFKDVVQRHGFPPLLMTKRGVEWPDGDDTFAISMIEGFPAIIINADVYNDKLARNKVSSMYPEMGALQNTERFLVSDRVDATLVHEWAHFLNRSALANHPDPEMRALASFWWSESWDIDPQLKGLAKVLSAMGIQAEDKFSQRVIGARKFAKKVNDRKSEKWNGYPHVLSQYGQMMPAEAFAEGVAAILVDDVNLRDMVSPQMRDDIFDIMGKPRRYTRDIASGIDENRAGLASLSVQRNVDGDREIVMPGDPGFAFSPFSGRDWLKDATNEEIADAIVPRSHMDAINLTIMNMFYGQDMGRIGGVQNLVVLMQNVNTQLFGDRANGTYVPIDFSPKGIERSREIVLQALNSSPEFAYLIRTYGSLPIMVIDENELNQLRAQEQVTGFRVVNSVFDKGGVMGWTVGQYGIVINTASRMLKKNLPIGQRQRVTGGYIAQDGQIREFIGNVDLSAPGTLYHEWFHGYYSRIIGWHSLFNTRGRGMLPGQRQERIDYIFPGDTRGAARSLTIKEAFDGTGFIPFSDGKQQYVPTMINESRREISKNGDDPSDFDALITAYQAALVDTATGQNIWNPEMASELAQNVGQRYPYLVATMAPLIAGAYATASRQEHFAEMGTLFVTPDKQEKAKFLTPEAEAMMAFVLGLKDDTSVGDYDKPWETRQQGVSSRVSRAAIAQNSVGQRLHTGSGIFITSRPASPTSDVISSENGIINASMSGYEFSIVGELPTREAAYTAWNDWEQNWRMRYSSSQIMGLGMLSPSEDITKWQSMTNNHIMNGDIDQASDLVKQEVQESFMMAMSLMKAVADGEEISDIPLFHSMNNVSDDSPLINGSIGDTISMPLTSFGPSREKVSDLSAEDGQSTLQDAINNNQNRVIVQLQPGAFVSNSDFIGFENISGVSEPRPIESITAGDFRIVDIREENGMKIVEVKHTRVADPMLGLRDTNPDIDTEANEEKAGLASKVSGSRNLVEQKRQAVQSATTAQERMSAVDDVNSEIKRHRALTQMLMSRGDELDRLDGPKTVGGLASMTPLSDRAKQHGVSLDAFDDEKFDEDDVEWSTNEWSLGKTNRVMAGDVVVLRTRNDGKQELLTIERKSGPFRGAVSLPGGLQDGDEDLYDTAEREMFEEVNVSPKDAKGRRILGQVEVRDWDPRFVEGGRIAGIRFDIDEEQSSVVKAGDDAGKFNWIDVEELSRGERPIAFGHASWLAEAFADDPVLGPRFAVLAEASRVRNQRLIKKIDAKRREAGVKEFGEMPDPSLPYTTTTEGIRTGLSSIASSGRNINVSPDINSGLGKALRANIDYLNTNPINDGVYGREINGVMLKDVIDKVQQGKITHRDATAAYLALKEIYNRDFADMQWQDEFEMRMLMNKVRGLVSGNQDHKIVPFSRDGKTTYAVYRNADYLGDYDTEQDAKDVVQLSMAERSSGLASASVPFDRTHSELPEKAKAKFRAEIDAKQQEIDSLSEINDRLRSALEELKKDGVWNGEKYNIKIDESDGLAPTTYTREELEEEAKRQDVTFERYINGLTDHINYFGYKRKRKIDDAKEEQDVLKQRLDFLETREQNENSFYIHELLADKELEDELRIRNAQVKAMSQSERNARYTDDEGYIYVLHWGASTLQGGELDPTRSRGQLGAGIAGNTRQVNDETARYMVGKRNMARRDISILEDMLRQAERDGVIDFNEIGRSDPSDTLRAGRARILFGVDRRDGDVPTATADAYRISQITSQIGSEQRVLDRLDKVADQLIADDFQYSSTYRAAQLQELFGSYGGRYAEEGSTEWGDGGKKSPYTGIHVFRVKVGEDAVEENSVNETHLVGKHKPVASLIAENQAFEPIANTWAGWVDMVIEQDKERRRTQDEIAMTLSEDGRMPDIPSRTALGKSMTWVDIATKSFLDDAPTFDIKSLNYTKPELRERIKNRIMAGSKGGKPGQWSARKAQLLAIEYRKAGGGYRGGLRKTQRSLKKWTREKWTTSDGKPAIRKGGTRRYLPASAWSKLTPAQRAATNRKKIIGSRTGRQFVANTRSAANASRRARRD